MGANLVALYDFNRVVQSGTHDHQPLQRFIGHMDVVTAVAAGEGIFKECFLSGGARHTHTHTASPCVCVSGEGVSVTTYVFCARVAMYGYVLLLYVQRCALVLRRALCSCLKYSYVLLFKVQLS
jgi:hypothetical protein